MNARGRDIPRGSSPPALEHHPDTTAPHTPTGWLTCCASPTHNPGSARDTYGCGAAPAGAWRASWWQSALLGVVLILAGLLVLRDATAATVVSAVVFGLALLCAGFAEIVQAFDTLLALPVPYLLVPDGRSPR